MKTPSYEPAGFDTGLTDAEWALVEPFLFPPEPNVDAGDAVSRTPRAPALMRSATSARPGASDRCCPRSLLRCAHPSGSLRLAVSLRSAPPRSTVHDAFAAWTRQGLWPRINTTLRERVRLETLKNRQAQRRDHRQPERQGRPAPRREQRLRRGQKDQRPQAPHSDRHHRPAPRRGGHSGERAGSRAEPRCSCASSATAC